MSKNVVKLAERAADDPVAALEEVVAHLKRAAADTGERAQEALEDAAIAVRRAAKHLAKDAKREGEALLKKAGEEIKAHPKTTAAVAAAAVTVAGVLVARRMGRSRKKQA